jgi:glycosyltransferase involved in cell wall biosynthesis
MGEPHSDHFQEHDAFLSSSRKHILMLTIHGIHQWDIVPGLPDTGGQNVFVNQFSKALADQGYKITIANRGGYPHPITGKNRRGLIYKDQNQRILYLDDGFDQFVRKEHMAARIPDLVKSLTETLDTSSIPLDWIISHYWDAGRVGQLYNQNLASPVKHIWIPHSLGSIKKANVSPQQWADLRIDQRIEIEMDLTHAVDGIGSTSSRIQTALSEDYGYTGRTYWLPPCVDPDRFHPRQISEQDQIWEFLSNQSGLSLAQVRACQIITEISRTDTTKRKNVLIEAFALVHRRFPRTLLVISIDENHAKLAHQLKELIRARKVDSHTAVVGSIWDLLPSLYAISDIYCTPSIMEGFGMSAQEAAATGVPIVASENVPFATEYLLGENPRKVAIPGQSGRHVILGEGAIVVPADEVAGFAHALELLLSDEALRKKMGNQAYRITIPKFTWESVVSKFLEAVEGQNPT